MPLGMHRETGKPLDMIDHLRQSIQDILTTPVGTRLHRRDYGSDLPRMVDRPMNESLTARLVAGIARALDRWEPRVKVHRISITDATPGHVTLNLSAVLITDGTPLQIDGIVIPS